MTAVTSTVALLARRPVHGRGDEAADEGARVCGVGEHVRAAFLPLVQVLRSVEHGDLAAGTQGGIPGFA